MSYMYVAWLYVVRFYGKTTFWCVVLAYYCGYNIFRDLWLGQASQVNGHVTGLHFLSIDLFGHVTSLHFLFASSGWIYETIPLLRNRSFLSLCYILICLECPAMNGVGAM